jgi:hypothetical protein
LSDQLSWGSTIDDVLGNDDRRIVFLVAIQAGMYISAETLATSFLPAAPPFFSDPFTMTDDHVGARRVARCTTKDAGDFAIFIAAEVTSSPVI